QVEYKGVSYWSNVVVFSQGDALLSVPITVYDSTSSSEDLWIERAHLILEFEPGAIVVQEMHIFVNGGDKVYASSLEGSRRTAHFPLPSGATDLEMTEALMTCCIEMVEGGFAYTRPIVPGEMEFFFSYRLPYQTTSYTLSKNVVYPIHSADVLIADEGVKVTSSNLTAREPVTPQGRRYLHFSAQGLAQGDDLTLQLTDLPLTIQPREVQSPVSTVQGRAFMALGALAVLLVLSYPFWRHPRGEKN
ncbi:MAG: hypothetical protein L6435_15350, partial [Anaerolineae bacterium]|nr:hypothetical protein [Anaerolineae bacterium]